MLVVGLMQTAAGAEVFVRSSSLSVGVNLANGRITSIDATNGVRLASKYTTDLFWMELSRVDDFSANARIGPSAAAAFRHEIIPGGVKLVWENLGDKLAWAACTIRAEPGDARVRFGISFAPTNGWAVISTAYPNLRMADRIGADASDDSLLFGNAHGGILSAPATNTTPRVIGHYKQPGNLTVQAMMWWDPTTLFYCAAEDAKGDVKIASVQLEKLPSMMFRWKRESFDAEPVCLDYDFTIAAVCGTPDWPVTWHDGADLYREWARGTRLCSVPTARRRDIPAWLAEAPAFTLFTREWFDAPDTIRRWVREFWRRLAPDVPIVVGSWGWEHFYTWVHPYFPCHPSDEAFTSLTRDLAGDKAYFFPWPSGYHWTLTYGKKPDGTFRNNWRADFEREAAPHACVKRDGSLLEITPYWLEGGTMAAMCGGDEWTQKWFSEDVAGELARRGCRLVQADQNNGGAFPPCWSRSHRHPPGEGRWKTEVARRQLVGMAEAIGRVHGAGGATYEEPNEQMHDLMAIQLLRDANAKNRNWASLYGYIYHEYIPMFQPYPARAVLRWMAYSAAEGHMPRIVPSKADFERGGLAMKKDFLAGQFGGEGTNKFHVGKNISVEDKLFTPGTRLRITAQCRTVARPAGRSTLLMHYGVYTTGLKALARGAIDFPKKPADCMTTLVSEFTMPEGPAAMLRIMLNADSEARGEVGDMKLEVVNPDGSTAPAELKGSRWLHGYIRRWVELHHGEGRPWLAHGRRIRPPRLDCAYVNEDGAVMPAVYVAAYESLDGRRAIVLANATHVPQDVRCTFKGGRTLSFRLAPEELRLEKSGN